MALFDWRKLIGLDGPDRDTQGRTGLGPDYPETAGDRERGKFRPSNYPRLVQLAVCNDDQSKVTGALEDKLDELIREIRLLRLALTMQGVAADIDGVGSSF